MANPVIVVKKEPFDNAVERAGWLALALLIFIPCLVFLRPFPDGRYPVILVRMEVPRRGQVKVLSGLCPSLGQLCL